MKRSLRLFTKISAAIFIVAALFLWAAPAAQAIEVVKCEGLQTGEHVPAICEGSDEKLFGPNSIWTNIINTLLLVIGAIALLMIIIGAMRYTLSGGDQAQITSAKNTILYSVIGLVIAMMAGGIINFVLVNI
ncbi:MAG TPA: hypothetical protein VFZ58_03180 [Candidatus Saccharimonadales bacterium]